MISKEITTDHISIIFKTIVNLAEVSSNGDQYRLERTLFVFSCLNLLRLRISELVASSEWEPKMSHFQQRNDGSWFFMTLRQGCRITKIDVDHAMLKRLKRWRKFLGLSPFPKTAETIPLLPTFYNGKKKPMSSIRTIRADIQRCFDIAAQQMLDKGETDQACQLVGYTANMLRFTSRYEDLL